MNAYSESTYLGDVLKCEAPNLYSREAVTVLAGDGAERVLKVRRGHRPANPVPGHGDGRRRQHRRR